MPQAKKKTATKTAKKTTAKKCAQRSTQHHYGRIALRKHRYDDCLAKYQKLPL